MSLVDALQGIADEAHAARGKIVEPAEIVEQGARQRIGVERVYREIAPRGVFAPVVGIIVDRVAAVGRNVSAQRRHLDRAADDHRDDRYVANVYQHPLASRPYLTSTLLLCGERNVSGACEDSHDGEEQ